MSIETRCKCGWCGPISEVYLGGQIACPACGEQIDVNTPSAPYSYPPFPAWDSQRRPAPRMPLPRTAQPVHAAQTRSSGIEAWNALGVSIAAVILSLGRFSWIVAIVLAICAIAAAVRAHSQAVVEHKPKPFKATLAIYVAVLSLVMSVGSMSACLPCKHKRTAPLPEKECWKDHAVQGYRADLRERMEQGREAATRRPMEQRTYPELLPWDAEAEPVPEQRRADESACECGPPECTPRRKDPARETRSDWSNVNEPQEATSTAD